MSDHNIELPTQISSGNRTKHLIVSPDCFKESLMMMNTTRAKQIRKYYVQVEKVFRQYMKYNDECNKMQLQQTQKELEEAKKSSEAFKMIVLNMFMLLQVETTQSKIFKRQIDNSYGYVPSAILVESIKDLIV